MSDIEAPQKQQKNIKTYTHFAVMSIIINYAVGTGILNLPHTVAAASIVISLLMMCLISLSSYLLGQFSLEALSRTFALIRLGKLKVQDYANLNEQQEDLYTKLGTDSTTNQDTEQIDFVIPNNYTYQISKLCQFYYGKTGFYIYQIGQCIYFFGTIWGYSSVIAQTLTSVIPFKFLPHFSGDKWVCSDPCRQYVPACSDAYWIWISVAMVFSVIMIFFNLAEQKILQSVFTVCRFLLLGITAILTIYCLSTQPFLESGYSNNFINPNTKWFSFNFTTLGTLFSSITFSQVYHHSLPGILQPTQQKYQPKLSISIFLSFIFLLCVTVLTALPGALYFGEDGSDLVVLNFNTWTGKSFNQNEKQSGFAIFTSYLIRLLPPFYVLASIPINGLTMSLNIQEMMQSHVKTKLWVRVIVNLCCIIPPILLGGFLRCLGVIIEFTGLMGYMLMLAPAFVVLKSMTYFDGQDKCPFSTVFSKKWIVITIIVFNLIGFCLTVYSLIRGLIK